ncbi:YebC/PmpR family DNA-binding transcriptional regulator [Patescibacteria group bacterium]
MSGHSKWSKIKHKKGAADAKRGAIFSKLGNAITVAAKQGGADSDMNFSLRLAIDKAKSSNMPKENIERAVKRGSGEGSGGPLEEIMYEGFLPGQSNDGQRIAILIECLTGNKNRSVTEIKNILNKSGGSLANSGAVNWMFEKKGIITINKKLDDELELQLIETGAEDIEQNKDEIIVYTKPENLQKVKESLDQKNILITSADIEFVAKEPVRRSLGEGGKKEILQEQAEKLQKIFDLLDESDDITNYYTSIK